MIAIRLFVLIAITFYSFSIVQAEERKKETH